MKANTNTCSTTSGCFCTGRCMRSEPFPPHESWDMERTNDMKKQVIRGGVLPTPEKVDNKLIGPAVGPMLWG